MYLNESGLTALWDKIKTVFAPKSHTHDASQVSGLASVATSGGYSDLSGKPSVATDKADGLMSADDKSKLNSIDAELASTKTDLANTKTDLSNTKAELTATKTTADDAYGRTLRIELVSVPADDQGDTSRLTACVYRGGELLTNQDVAKLGILTWYENGTKKGTGLTHTCGAGTAVECKLVGTGVSLISESDFIYENGTTYENGVWSIPANNTSDIKNSIIERLHNTDVVSRDQTFHLGLSVRAASGASVAVVPGIMYLDNRGNPNLRSAKFNVKGTGTWQRMDISLILPSGMRPGSFIVSQAPGGAAVELTDLSLSSQASLAVATHTPYATEGHLQAVYATRAQLASLRDSVSKTAAKVPGKIFVGSVVTTTSETLHAPSGHEAKLFTKEEFTAYFGRPFDPSKDYVGVMNADGTAFNGYVESAGYFSSENIWVGVPGVADGITIRLNYLVVLGD